MTTFKHPTNAKTIETTTPLEELVLFALNYRELYGLQIAQAITEASGGSRNIRVGSLYPTLHSLENKGLISSRWGDEQREERGGARRRYYKITPNGAKTIEFIEGFRNNLIKWQPV
jgi:DNA-binding PadR family transcriptional regulator